MRGYEICSLIRKYPILLTHFFGVFSVEKVSQLDTIPVLSFIICNTAKFKEPGEHWFFIFRRKYNSFEIFNSEGYSDLALFAPYLLELREKISPLILRYNKNRYQPHGSVTCGKFSVFFAIQITFNLQSTFSEILKTVFIKKSPEKNQNRVISFFS